MRPRRRGRRRRRGRLTVAAGLARRRPRLAAASAKMIAVTTATAPRWPPRSARSSGRSSTSSPTGCRGASRCRGPRSRCPGCETPIRPYDNVPVLSWLLLRGRCRACRRAISRRYPLVELATARCCWRSSCSRGRGRRRLLGLVLVLLLVADHADRPRPPDHPQQAHAARRRRRARHPRCSRTPARCPEHLIAGAAAGGFLLVAALAYPGGMGHGRREARRR